MNESQHKHRQENPKVAQPDASSKPVDHSAHEGHTMGDPSKMGFWQKLKMSMTMSMGMEHGGLAGREMAKLMEVDIRNKFFVAFILSIPIFLLKM